MDLAETAGLMPSKEQQMHCIAVVVKLESSSTRDVVGTDWVNP